MAAAQESARTFVAPLKTPGRCAPALIEDLTLYDPRARNPTGRNLLQDNPFNLTDAPTLGQALPDGSCGHVFSLKERQSQLPLLDERPTAETIWIVAVFCQKCRIHLTLKVDYTARPISSPCPNPDRPFHHLQFAEWRTSLERDAWLRDHAESSDEIYTYECSSQQCGAVVTIHLSQPVLIDRDVFVLTDRNMLRDRTEEAFKSRNGDTEGMRYPLPIDVLNDLRAYLRNAWEDDPKFRKIKLANKRFMVRFGPDGTACKNVLEELHFQLQPGECWSVPEPNRSDVLPYKDPLNILLDNAEHELSALILMCPVEDRQATQDQTSLTPATVQLERALGTLDYDKYNSGRAVMSPAARTNEYFVLGAVQTLSDRGINACYQWETTVNPDMSPWFMKALKEIASSRNSEILQTELVLEQSKGKFDADDISAAYSYFGLNSNDPRLDDDYITGLFTSRLQDSPTQEHQMRQHLRLIGVERKSNKIIDTADNVLDTYEQALRFLEADGSVSDDHIQALFAVKIGEDKTLEEQAIKAVKIVAEHRNSALLTNWVNSGFTNNMQMDAAEGYQALQIDNRTVEDDLIITQYDVLVQDNPNNIEYYNRALSAIATDRNSTTLKEHLHGSIPQDSRGTTEEPVGLDNIGNTCYLNSLLQFLFTIAELRRIVLDFDKYKMEVSERTMVQKKVGQRKVTNREVETAQKFVTSLASLFTGMIETPQSAIRPQQELARLTLETDSAKEKIRRRSTLMSDRPNLGHVDSRPLLGPLQMPNSEPLQKDDMAVQSPEDISDVTANPLDRNEIIKQQDPADIEMISTNDNSSEATLVSRPGSQASQLDELPTAEQQQALFEDKENLAPTKLDSSPKHVVFEAQDTTPLRPASPSKLNAQAGALAAADSLPSANEVVYQPPPGKPPPVPPRRPVESSADILEEYARQQDVTEVIAHCLFQLSCAMRPTGFDKSGEQLDEIHDLFFGQGIGHTVPEKDTPTPVQFFNVITRVAHEPADVYAALDTEYDLSVRDDESKAFLSISELPPIFSIALDRVIWDKKANRPAKLNHHVNVPETIFLDRYVESVPGSDLLQRRSNTWEIKKELSSLQERRKVLEQKHAQSVNLPGLFGDAKYILEHLQTEIPDEDEYGNDIQVNPNTIATLSLLAEELQNELDVITQRIEDLKQQVKEAFVDMRKHPYRLHAAFFHRGSAGGGHYWVYIYDHNKEIWRKYNDDRVNVVENRNEIFGRPELNTTWGAPPNPYFLVYVREDEVDTLVETVKRNIIYPPPDDPPPIPARNQMSEMPPTFSGFGASGPGPVTSTPRDVNMHDAGEQYSSHDQQPPQTQHVEDAEHIAAPPFSNDTLSGNHHLSDVQKTGDWDSNELMVDDLRKWQ